MGTPKITKMDIGFGYVSKAFWRFCSQWNFEHKTDISYNPQGQGIVKCAYGSLKTQLQKVKTRKVYPQMTHNAFSHVLFALNFLNIDVHEQSAVDKFLDYGTKATFAKTK